MVGPVLSIACAWVTAWAYRRHNVPYSLLSQAISDLGNLDVSALAVVFNVGFVLGGAGMAAFVLGVRPYLSTMLLSFTAALSLMPFPPRPRGSR